MSGAVWKFELNPGEVTILMPIGAKPLAVNMQGRKLCLWAEVDPLAAKEARHFVTYGTGHPMLDLPHTFIGTFFLDDNSFVFHVFEVKK